MLKGENSPIIEAPYRLILFGFVQTASDGENMKSGNGLFSIRSCTTTHNRFKNPPTIIATVRARATRIVFTQFMMRRKNAILDRS